MLFSLRTVHRTQPVGKQASKQARIISIIIIKYHHQSTWAWRPQIPARRRLGSASAMCVFVGGALHSRTEYPLCVSLCVHVIMSRPLWLCERTESSLMPSHPGLAWLPPAPAWHWRLRRGQDASAREGGQARARARRMLGNNMPCLISIAPSRVPRLCCTADPATDAILKRARERQERVCMEQ